MDILLLSVAILLLIWRLAVAQRKVLRLQKLRRQFILFAAMREIVAVSKARRAAISETMECARQIVKSYGPDSVKQIDRDHICGSMDHYEKTAK